MTKIGIAKQAYRGAPRGVAMAFPDAPELRSSSRPHDWAYDHCQRRIAKAQNDALALLQRMLSSVSSAQ